VWERIKENASDFIHDQLGIDSIDVSACLVVCFEVGLDFTHGGDITHIGVGIGAGGSISISTPAFDISAGIGGGATIGYDRDRGLYYSERGSIGPVGYSGLYYPNSGTYSVSAGYGYGPASVSLGYNSDSGLSAAPGIMGVSYDTGTGRVGANVDVYDLVDTYNAAVAMRKYNGYGPEGGSGAFSYVDKIGTVTANWEASDNHDKRYEIPGYSKVKADILFFSDMAKGSLSNLAFKRNGFIKAGVGLAISPIYYSAVAFGGGAAYRAGQATALDRLSAPY
jgi:hypothetical protein